MLVTRPTLVASGLLIASAVLFAAGAAIERDSGEAREAHPATSQAATSADRSGSTQEAETAVTAGSGEENDSDQHADADASSKPTAATPERSRDSDAGAKGGDADGGTEHRPGEHSENLLGVNPESAPLTGTAVALSALLALALLISGSPLLAAGTALAMAAFTVLDIREVIHQVDESRSGLAVLASAVAVLHGLAAVATLALARRRHSAASPATPTQAT